jgi:hypothetical protein
MSVCYGVLSFLKMYIKAVTIHTGMCSVSSQVKSNSQTFISVMLNGINDLPDYILTQSSLKKFYFIS